jgi:hypothetical protein
MPTTLYDQTLAAWTAGDDEFVANALFAFEIDDGDYIQRVTEAIRSLLELPDLTPRQIVAIGRMLLGLSRMPLLTPGLGVEVSLRFKTEQSAISYDLFFSQNHFETSSSGYNNFGFGSDSFSGSNFIVESHARQCDAGASYAESWPDIFLEMTAAALEIRDDSDDQLLDWEHPNGAVFWGWIEQHG